jgi:protein-tyrosine phosphatase
MLDPDVGRFIDDGLLLPIGDARRYVLVEFPITCIPKYAYDALFDIVARGYVPVIAHPERYFAICEDPERLAAFIRSGALTQVDVGSLIGVYGSSACRCAARIIEHSMCHFIATDAHTAGFYEGVVTAALGRMEEQFGPDLLETLTVKNPQAALLGLDIEVPDPIPWPAERKESSLLGGWMARLKVPGMRKDPGRD